MNKYILGVLVGLSLVFSAEALQMYSNQAAKDNADKYAIVKQDVSGLESLMWKTSRNKEKFERDPNWKYDPEQARADGLSFMTIQEAAKRGDLVSQASYDELVKTNNLDIFHSKNIKHRFSQPFKIIALIIALLVSFFLLRKLVKILNKMRASVKDKQESSINITKSSNKNNSIQRGSLLLSAGMLLVGVFPLPYDYYTLLRLVVTLTAVISAHHFHKAKMGQTAIIFGFIALLFNPLIPLHLNKPMWLIIDIVVAVYMYSISKKRV